MSLGKLKKKGKRKYYQDFFENNLDNMKKAWKGIKEILNKNIGTQILPLVYEGKQVNTNEGMAISIQ